MPLGNLITEIGANSRDGRAKKIVGA